jgi:hypothetical protein
LSLFEVENNRFIEIVSYRWSAYAMCESLAIQRGFLTTKAGRPDVHRSANFILKDVVDGKLVLSFRPPPQETWNKIDSIISAANGPVSTIDASMHSTGSDIPTAAAAAAAAAAANLDSDSEVASENDEVPEENVGDKVSLSFRSKKAAKKRQALQRQLQSGGSDNADAVSMAKYDEFADVAKKSDRVGRRQQHALDRQDFKSNVQSQVQGKSSKGKSKSRKSQNDESDAD